MILRLTTGDRVPVDGEITEGEVWMDEAMLTGEPIPQQKTTGDTVSAGPPCRTAPYCSVPPLSAAKPRWHASLNWCVRLRAVNRKSASWQIKSQPSLCRLWW